MSRERPTELPRAVILGGGSVHDKALELLAKAQPLLALPMPPAPPKPTESGFGKMLDAVAKFGERLSEGVGKVLPATPISAEESARAVAKVRAFYARRPRPWRPHSARPNRRRGPVYDKLLRRSA